MLIYLAIIIVVIIIIIYLLRTKKTAAELYENTDGTLDTHARRAYNEAAAQPRGAFIQAAILENNILGGDAEFDPAMEAAIHAQLAQLYEEVVDEIIGDARVLPLDNMIVAHYAVVNPRRGHVAHVSNIAKRKKNIDAETKIEATTAFLDDAKQVFNDPQNVHDTHVNKDLAAKMDLIRLTGGEPEERAALAEFSAYAAGIPDAVTRARVMRTFSVMKENNTHLSKIGARELSVLAAVWNRAKQNPHEKANQIRDALIAEMADAAAGENVVCANGRVGRIIDSLTLLDKDDALNGEIKSMAVIRNEVFGEAQKIVTEFIARNKNSGDADMRAVADSYAGIEPELSPAAMEAAEKKFKAALIELLDANVNAAGKKYGLGTADIDFIKTECRAAV